MSWPDLAASVGFLKSCNNCDYLGVLNFEEFLDKAGSKLNISYAICEEFEHLFCALFIPYHKARPNLIIIDREYTNNHSKHLKPRIIAV